MTDSEQNVSMQSEAKDEEAFVAVFSSSNHDAEMEAMTIQGILESNNIPNMLVGPHMLPNLEFQVQVPEGQLETAAQLIEEARKAGPAAAEEGARESERAV